MHVDWSCYVLILLEGEPGKRCLFLYRAHHDPIAQNLWRLPGGMRIEGEDDPRQTLNRLVALQTGFNIREKEVVLFVAAGEHPEEESLESSNETPPAHFYSVTVTNEEYLNRTNFEIPEQAFLEPKLESWCLESTELYGPHTEIIHPYLTQLPTHP